MQIEIEQAIEKAQIILPDTYNYNFSCGNCNQSVGLRIPIGIAVGKYAQDYKCPNCGCSLAGQSEQQYIHPVGTPMVYLPYGLRRELW